MLYLYVLTRKRELSDSDRAEIQEAFPQPLGRKPRILSVERVDSIPEEISEDIEADCVRVSGENGINLNLAQDEIVYSVREFEGEEYGVCQIHVSRFVIPAVFVAAAMGFVVGLALGVTSASVWLLTIGLGGFVVYLWLRGSARRNTEGWLFSTGPVLIMSWLVGFVVHGVVF